MTVIESALVVHYLIDSFPERSAYIFPSAGDPEAAYKRYQINLLLDTWSNKVGSLSFRAQLLSGTEGGATASVELFEAIKTHIEPQLAKLLVEGKGPFVGGSERLTLFEVSSAFP